MQIEPTIELFCNKGFSLHLCVLHHIPKAINGFCKHFKYYKQFKPEGSTKV